MVIEASLAIVSSSLPTIRPIFHGMSPESVIRSVRSVLSLNSLRSNGSKHDAFDHPEIDNRKDSSSSSAGLKDKEISMGPYGFDNEVTHTVPLEHVSPVPKDGMLVHKSFTVLQDTV